MKSWLLLGWLSGLLSVLAWSLMGWLSLRKLGFQARVIDASHVRTCLDEGCDTLGIRRAVKLLESDARTMPMTWGVIRPTILLPASACDWSPKRMRAVLLHELAHVKQRDVLWLMMVRLAQALHWFNPLVWIAGRKLRDECERSCDDTVLRHGALPPDYAEHVLRVAVDYPETARGADAAVALARMSSLERRLRAILDPRIRRAALRGRVMAMLCIFGLCVVLPLSAMRATVPVSESNSDSTQESPMRSIQITVKGEDDTEILKNVRLYVRRAFDTEYTLDIGEDAEHILELSKSSSQYVMVVAMADGHVPIRKSWRPEAGVLDLPDEYTFTLPKGTKIGGRVVDENGDPISGATMKVSVFNAIAPAGAYLWFYPVTTDDDGRWVCDAMPHEYSQIAINRSHPEFISDRWNMLETYHEESDPPLSAFLEFDATIVMHDGIKVHGRVVGADGQPISGATIGYQSGDSFRTASIAESGPDGRYTFEAAAGLLTLTAFADGHAPFEKLITVKKDMDAFEVKLPPAQVIAGRVVDRDGAPIAHAWAAVDMNRHKLFPRWRGLTDENGRFEWESAPNEPVVFSFGGDGYLSSRDIEIRPGHPNQDVVLTPELVFVGKVTDAKTGKPVDSFLIIEGIHFKRNDRVVWERMNAKKGEDGVYEFLITFPRDGGHGLLIEAEGYAPAQSPVYADDAGRIRFDIALQPASGISGIVRQPNGTLATDATVIADAMHIGIDNGKLNRFNPDRTLSVEVDGKGRFELPVMLEKPAIVAVSDAGYAVLRPDAIGAAPEVTLTPWSTIEGVYRIGDKPAAHVEVVCSEYPRINNPTPQIRFSERTTTDEEGRFRFERMPSGRGSVHVYVNQTTRVSGYAQHESYSVETGGTVQVDLGGRGRPVVGRLADVEYLGKPLDLRVAQCSIHAPRPNTLPEDWEQRSTEEKQEWSAWWRNSEEAEEQRWKMWKESNSHNFRLEADGTFRIEDVVPGEYEIDIKIMGAPSEANYFGDTIAQVNQSITIESIPDGRTDDPLDVGELALTYNTIMKIGDAAPDFEVETLDGGVVKLADLRGKYVLLDFWATWCGPCIKETPNLKAVYDQFGDDDRLVMIGLSLDKKMDKPREYVAKNKLNWIQGFLGEWAQDKVAETYGVHGIPQIMLIGPEGNIHSMNLRGRHIAEAVELALRADRND